MYPLYAEEDWDPPMDVGPPNLTIFTEQYALEPAVNKALEALGDTGVSADMYRLR